MPPDASARGPTTVIVGAAVTAFSPDRFDDAETETYLEETLAQKHVVRRRH